MKKAKVYLGMVLVIIGLGLVVYPTVYWVFNDTLTYIQMIKEVWYVYPLMFVLLGTGTYLLNNELS
jgi:uncharacterized protein involved in outer membrane biogenesis